MFHKIPPVEDFLTRVVQALTQTLLQTRCAELTVLLDRGNLNELHSVFPILINNIFGPCSTESWNPRQITAELNRPDFQALQHFLSPQGPVFKLIYTLLRDPQIKFDFDILNLPENIRLNLKSRNVHPFYVDLLNIDPQTDRIISLKLNPFDYYFFHFAYHLTNPYQRFGQLQAARVDSVYYVLCCDYLLHFLPTTPNLPILPVLNFYNGKNPLYAAPPVNINPKVSRLLRAEVIPDVTQVPNFEHHPRNEIWRSETVMIVFIDIWLNSDQVLHTSNFAFTSQQHSGQQQLLHANELPSTTYIRILRVLVKHIHQFASSGRIDSSHMGELKKIAVPYIQGRMYASLRHLVHRWPLDGSFRLVLELWLSFIQPWRYKGSYGIATILKDEKVEEESGAVVGPEYAQFMAENLLAYTVVLQQLLPRFTNVDIASPKIALILFRLTKVFAQPGLVPMLRDLEASAVNLNSSPSHSFNSNPTLPTLSPTSSWSTNSPNSKRNQYDIADVSTIRKGGGRWTNVIKQKISELEGQSFQYKAVFDAPAATEVYTLIDHVKKSEAASVNTLKARVAEDQARLSGFFGFLTSIFSIPENNDEFTIEERNKVPQYLQLALKNLMEIFQITDITSVSQSFEQPSVSMPLKKEFDVSFMSTPSEVRKRVMNMKYEGDPDLYPVRSYESTVLVRMLYDISSNINKRFQALFSSLYENPSYIGRLARYFLCPPMTAYQYEKNSMGFKRRTAKYLPARISLRYFASHTVLFYFALCIAVSHLLGCGSFTLLFLLYAFWFGYICLKAVFSDPRARLEAELNQSFGSVLHNNSSFSDSF